MKHLITLCLIFAVTIVSAQKTMVKLKSSPTLGQYLVDNNDKTLYYFSNDADGTNHCSGGCVSAWPVFSGDVPSQAQLGEGLSAGDFGTLTPLLEPAVPSSSPK